MDFGVEDKNLSSGNIKGSMVFLGLGHQTPDKSWDDLKNRNIEGKIECNAIKCSYRCAYAPDTKKCNDNFC